MKLKVWVVENVSASAALTNPPHMMALAVIDGRLRAYQAALIATICRRSPIILDNEGYQYEIGKDLVLIKKGRCYEGN